MNSILESFSRALSLIFHLDAELLGIILLSLKVSGIGLLIGAAGGLPVGAFLGLRNVRFKSFLITMTNTFMGLPPVVVGLFLYLLLSRSGPLGFMSLLYTSTAMIIAQSILAFPIVAALSHSAIDGVDPVFRQASETLGATPVQVSWTIIKEARFGIMSGIVAAFGRVIAEVGAILIVGGNIAGDTRVMTTAIALETDKGEFELAMALGIILITISLIINSALFLIQRRGAGGIYK